MWFRNSWKSYFSEQLPNYIDNTRLRIVEYKLGSLKPLIDYQTIDILQKKLLLVEKNEAFILHMGECAESFSNCYNKEFIQDFYKFFLSVSDIIETNLKLPVVKIGRIAGQFAKPRSKLVEEDNISSFRGEIINGFPKNLTARRFNPSRMISAYFSSKKALNYIKDYYDNLSNIKGNHQDQINTKNVRKDFLFTSHEALLLNYEASLTRRVDNLGYYNLSAHMVWLGARTGGDHSPHIEYLRGISNPVAIKVHKDMSPDYLIKVINILNPKNTPGKIVLILRLSKEDLKSLFPLYIWVTKKLKLNLSFICDPMHPNTKMYNTYKVRYFDDLLENIKTFIDTCKTNNIVPQGVHLEAVHLNVTECIGGEVNKINKDDIFNNYQTTCDPRLNKRQTMEIIAKTLFFMQN